jgi:hypothetical protein
VAKWQPVKWGAGEGEGEANTNCQEGERNRGVTQEAAQALAPVDSAVSSIFDFLHCLWSSIAYGLFRLYF